MAPRAFLVPISLVRSVMETSMMFITPMPPTSRDIPAITAMASCMVPMMVVICSTTDCILMT